jgi:hypothetical protein
MLSVYLMSAKLVEKENVSIKKRAIRFMKCYRFKATPKEKGVTCIEGDENKLLRL